MTVNNNTNETGDTKMTTTTISTERSNEIANTTLQQIGGSGRLAMMIGAKHFLSHEDGSLTFKFKGSRKMNYIRITLDACDTYTMSFQKFSPSKGTVKMVEEISGVYNDMLKSIFESKTGLYLSF
jgi:hypothetical protein